MNLRAVSFIFHSIIFAFLYFPKDIQAAYVTDPATQSIASILGTITLQDKVESLEEELDSLKNTPKEKDIWDKLSAVSGLISGGLVAAIGIAATYTYNERQRKNSEDQKHREITIQKVQTIQSFMPQLQPEDSKTVEAALLAITALGDPELATNLAVLFKSEGAISALEKIAISPDQESSKVAKKSLSGLFEPLMGLVAEIYTGPTDMPTGAGFSVGPNGEIITLDFIVDGFGDQKKNINEKNIRVKVGDAFYEAKVVDRDPVNMLALLQVENSTFSYLELVKDFNIDEKGNFVGKESVVMLKPAITT